MRPRYKEHDPFAASEPGHFGAGGHASVIVLTRESSAYARLARGIAVGGGHTVGGTSPSASASTHRRTKGLSKAIVPLSLCFLAGAVTRPGRLKRSRLYPPS